MVMNSQKLNGSEDDKDIGIASPQQGLVTNRARDKQDKML